MPRQFMLVLAKGGALDASKLVAVSAMPSSEPCFYPVPTYFDADARPTTWRVFIAPTVYFDLRRWHLNESLPTGRPEPDYWGFVSEPVWDIVRDFRSQGRTVLLTTHYMDEAERLCDRVAVVDHGQVIALGSPRELIASLGGEHIIDFQVSVPPEGSGQALLDVQSLSDLPSVRSARRDDDLLSLAVAEPHVALPALLARLREQGHELASLTTRHASLEDVFVNLTGRHLREEEAAAA